MEWSWHLPHILVCVHPVGSKDALELTWCRWSQRRYESAFDLTVQLALKDEKKICLPNIPREWVEEWDWVRVYAHLSVVKPFKRLLTGNADSGSGERKVNDAHEVTTNQTCRNETVREFDLGSFNKLLNSKFKMFIVYTCYTVTYQNIRKLINSISSLAINSPKYSCWKHMGK